MNGDVIRIASYLQQIAETLSELNKNVAALRTAYEKANKAPRA